MDYVFLSSIQVYINRKACPLLLKMNMTFVIAGMAMWFFAIGFQAIPLSTISASAGPFAVQASGISPVSALAFVMGSLLMFLGIRMGGHVR